jgi:hypothetical protein
VRAVELLVGDAGESLGDHPVTVAIPVDEGLPLDRVHR